MQYFNNDTRVEMKHIADKESIYRRFGKPVSGTLIDALSWSSAIEIILRWGKHNESRTVCLCNVHSAVTAVDNPVLAYALDNADMVLPDGAPIAWVLRRKGFKEQSRIAGPDLMYKLCENMQNSGISIFLFGASPETLEKLENNLQKAFPKLEIAGKESPVYGDWTAQQESNYINTIKNSGAGIVFVGLGCPKQEAWMQTNRENVTGVMLGVGAAFDFLAGTVERSPEIYQRFGLEWAHRLFSEPRRLWRRYLTTNTMFIYYCILEMLGYPKNR